jgi:hypothetical protein
LSWPSPARSCDRNYRSLPCLSIHSALTSVIFHGTRRASGRRPSGALAAAYIPSLLALPSPCAPHALPMHSPCHAAIIGRNALKSNPARLMARRPRSGVNDGAIKNLSNSCKFGYHPST